MCNLKYIILGGKKMSGILDRFSLQGKVAIVTGATRGLGQGIAVGLASAGADIVGVGTSDLSDTEQKVKALGRRFIGIRANLISQEPIAEIIEKTVSAFGKIDILVNNAGIIRRGDSIEFSEENWDDVMNINLGSSPRTVLD